MLKHMGLLGSFEHNYDRNLFMVTRCGASSSNREIVLFRVVVFVAVFVFVFVGVFAFVFGFCVLLILFSLVFCFVCVGLLCFWRVVCCLAPFAGLPVCGLFLFSMFSALFFVVCLVWVLVLVLGFWYPVPWLQVSMGSVWLCDTSGPLDFPKVPACGCGLCGSDENPCF